MSFTILNSPMNPSHFNWAFKRPLRHASKSKKQTSEQQKTSILIATRATSFTLDGVGGRFCA